MAIVSGWINVRSVRGGEHSVFLINFGISLTRHPISGFNFYRIKDEQLHNAKLERMG